MSEIVWQPTEEQIAAAQVTAFRKQVALSFRMAVVTLSEEKETLMIQHSTSHAKLTIAQPPA